MTFAILRKVWAMWAWSQKPTAVAISARLRYGDDYTVSAGVRYRY